MVKARTKTLLYFTLVQFVLLPIAGCGGRAANPVAAVQPGDSTLSCDGLRVEMSNVESQVAALIPESKKTGKNVALATAGIFLIVPFFFMDGGAAEKAEIKAYRARYGELQKQYAESGCGSIASEDGAAENKAIGTMSTKERLVELKALFDEDLISKDEYERARESLLNLQ